MSSIQSKEHRENFPVIKSFVDAIYQREALIEAVEKYPDTELIYHFPILFNQKDNLGNDHPWLTERWNWCISGSEALRVVKGILERAISLVAHDTSSKDALKDAQKLATILKLQMIPGLSPEQFIAFVEKNGTTLAPGLDNGKVRQIREILKLHTRLPSSIHGLFTPNDVDIFFLNSPINNRMKLPTVDLVHVTAKSVEDLLMGFDLPCCRVAFDSRHDYWISAQCLYSLFTGSYYLPSYLQTLSLFEDFLKTTLGQDDKKMTSITKEFHENLIQRTEKYQTRGFICCYYTTTHIPTWVLNRSEYW